MTTIVVTGANGFLGRHVVAGLRGRASPVLPLSRSPSRDADGVRIARYQDFAPPAGAVLLHLAEPAAVAAQAGATHVEAMLAQCRALLAQPWARTIYVSSAAVYGDNTDGPRRPGDPVTAGSAYIQAKLRCETEVLAAGGTVARLANLFGQGMASQTVLPEILAQLDRCGPLTVRNGKVIRDFLAVEDAARGLAMLAASTPAPGEIFNFGSGGGHRVEDIARLVLQFASQGARQVVSTDRSVSDSCLVLDIGDTRRRLGWRPEAALETWLERQVHERIRA